MRYHILFTMFLLITGCPGNQAPVVPTHTFTADASKCPSAKVNLDRLHCPNGQGGFLGDPNKTGTPYVDLCENLYTQGVNFQAPCVAAAMSCSEVDACRP
jgi:hypothetical protein